MKVFWPLNLKHKSKSQDLLLIGKDMENGCFIVEGIVDSDDERSDIIGSVNSSSPSIHLLALECVGSIPILARDQTGGVVDDLWIIYYTRPKSLQYYSLDNLILDLNDGTGKGSGVSRKDSDLTNKSIALTSYIDIANCLEEVLGLFLI